MTEQGDISTIMHLLLVEEAEKQGLTMESVRCFKSGKHVRIRIRFDDDHETAVGGQDNTGKDDLSCLLDLARSKRGHFQLWASRKRAQEYQDGLAKMAAKLGNGDAVNKISALAKDFDPEDCVTRKVGRTPGGRTYEVVDGPWGRRTIVIDEAMQTACQRGPFVKSATRIYCLADPGGMNGNTSKAKGWVRRARLYIEPRTSCRFLEMFVQKTHGLRRQMVDPAPESVCCAWNFGLSDAGQRLILAGKFGDRRFLDIPGFSRRNLGGSTEAYLDFFQRHDRLICMVPINVDLAGTHDPAKIPLRARRMALLASMVSTRGDVLPDLPEWKKKHKLAFPLEHRLFKHAWGLSYYEDGVTKANAMYRAIVELFQNDEARWQEFADRFKEVV